MSAKLSWSAPTRSSWGKVTVCCDEILQTWEGESKNLSLENGIFLVFTFVSCDDVQYKDWSQGRDKLCVGVVEPVRVVLETDGTQVEDGEYFQTLPENTIFIVLRPGEIWAPAGEDIVTQGDEHRTLV